MIAWTFKLRWILWAIGGLGILLLALRRKTLTQDLSRLETWAEPRFTRALATVCASWFVLGYLAKWTQLKSLSLNAQDFWLFEDLTRNLAQGGWMLTRFAPQWPGLTQHGAVHGTFTWALSAPLSWIVGPTHAALIYGPLAIAIAGALLGLLARPRFGAVGAIAIAIGFLGSTQVGHILMYDVHPEVAYPAAFLGWAWALGLGDGRVRPLALALATLAGIGIKEDSFLVFFPAILFCAIALRGSQRRAAALSFGGALLAYAGLVHAIGRWSSGAWGPESFMGLPVHIPNGPDLLQGRNWSSLSEATAIVSGVFAAHGGLTGALGGFGKFIFSRPWLSLLIFAPWLLREARFWIWLLPLAAATSLLGRASLLNLYYSAPFLGVFWALAALSERAKGRHPLLIAWLALAPLVFGNGSPELLVPSAQVAMIRDEVRSLQGSLPRDGRGVVQTQLLPWVSRAGVISDRPSLAHSADFYWLIPEHPSYEFPHESQVKLAQKLESSGKWKRLGKHTALWIRKE